MTNPDYSQYSSQMLAEEYVQLVQTLSPRASSEDIDQQMDIIDRRMADILGEERKPLASRFSIAVIERADGITKPAPVNPGYKFYVVSRILTYTVSDLERLMGHQPLIDIADVNLAQRRYGMFDPATAPESEKKAIVEAKEYYSLTQSTSENLNNFRKWVMQHREQFGRLPF